MAEFRRALDLFEQAYRLVPHLHVFNFHIGLAAFEAGDCDRAETALQRFLELVPDHPVRSHALEVLREIQRSLCVGDPGSTSGVFGNATFPLVDEVLHLDIDHQHVAAVLRRSYLNRSPQTMEGEFRLRAGQGANVTGFAYWNGEQKIVGEVFEKQVATEIYRQTVNRRRDPGLLEQIGEGSFSFRVFPIASRETKRIEVEFDQWLRRRGNDLELRLPLESATTEVDVTLKDTRSVHDVTSPTHAITVDDRRDGSLRVRSERSIRPESRELVLRWQLSTDPWRMEAFVHRDQGHDAYLVVSVAAPPNDGGGVVEKDLTLVIDRSGSMAGEALRQAKDAAVGIIERMSERDRVNVILFDDSVESLFVTPEPLSGDVRSKAIVYVQRTLDGGGTDLAAALHRALDAQRSDARPKTILFLTDGKSDTQQALRAIEGDNRDVRVFTVGVGEGVERALLSRLASSKRGRFTYIPSAAAVSSEVATLYQQIEAPVLVDLELESHGPRLRRMYPVKLPDLFDDDEIVLVARVEEPGPLDLRLTGRSASGPVEMRAHVDVPAQVRRSWVGQTWARQRVAHLLEEIALRGEQDELKDETIELALAYDIVTPYTAFLAMPESELRSDTARLMESARADKQRVLEANPDAVALAREPQDHPGSGAVRYSNSQADADDNPLHTARRAERESWESERRSAGCASCHGRDANFADGGWFLLMGLVLPMRRRKPPAVRRHFT